MRVLHCCSAIAGSICGFPEFVAEHARKEVAEPPGPVAGEAAAADATVTSDGPPAVAETAGAVPAAESPPPGPPVLRPPPFAVAGASMAVSGGPFECTRADLQLRLGVWQLEVEQCGREEIVARVPREVPAGLAATLRVEAGGMEVDSLEPATVLGVELVWKGGGGVDELVPVGLRVLGSDRPVRLQVLSRDSRSCRFPGDRSVEVVTRGGALNEATVVCRRSGPGPIEIAVRLVP
jgi:hypothetical protein